MRTSKRLPPFLSRTTDTLVNLEGMLLIQRQAFSLNRIQSPYLIWLDGWLIGIMEDKLYQAGEGVRREAAQLE